MSWGNVKEAAIECGLPPESWRTWERDGVSPRRIVETAQLISKRTGCDFMWLLTGSAGGASATVTKPTTAGQRHSLHPERIRPSGAPHGNRPPNVPNKSRRPALIGYRSVA